MFFIFESQLTKKNNYIFTEPVDIIKVSNTNDILPAFEKIEKYSKDYYIAGYFSYELGYYFDDFNIIKKNKIPLIYAGVFTRKIEARELPEKYLNGYQKDKNVYSISNLHINQPQKKYYADLKKIRRLLIAGDTYQVNYTQKINFKFSGNSFSLYQQLKESQPVDYAAFLEFDDLTILSLSPELFFKRGGNKIFFKPMKGTIARGKNINEDYQNKQILLNSEKERAENLMIVDLIRNDAGRICETGSVKTPKLFNIEKYSKLFQMTSDITGKLKKDISYYNIFKAVFPCGSVTGAPKFNTMRIINKLETEKRGVYCGAIGIISPQKKAVFNVAIRTITIQNNNAEMGIGGGITIDSLPAAEYSETLLKANFLTSARSNNFKLIESILFKNKFYYLKEHFNRMRASAKYFDYKFNKKAITKKILLIKNNLLKNQTYKIRILLDKSGAFEINYDLIYLEATAAPKNIIFSDFIMDSNDVFLYHKTTNRKKYDEEYRKYSARGFYDVIFKNKSGEITEGSFNNIIVEKKKHWFTPPIKSGLLPGVYRNILLTQKKIIEKTIFSDDILNADKLYLCNSVRGLIPVSIQ